MTEGEPVGCHDCGALYRWRPLADGQRARCTRCGNVLYRWFAHGPAPTPASMVAVTLGAVLVYLIAQCFPIVELEMNGLTSGATLLQAIGVLWNERMEVIAAMVFFFAVAFPALELGALLYVSAGLLRGRRPPGFHLLLRVVQGARHWAMTEVLMIGILVTAIKMTSLARVIPHPGLFAFAALTILAAVALRYEPRALWALGEQIDPAPRPPEEAAPAQPIDCHACGLLNGGACEGRHCRRCGAVLHRRIPNSITWTWALLAAAAMLYVPANILPVMYTESIGGTGGDTIMSGVVLFWETGSPGLAIVIFVASVLVPVSKLVALAVLAGTAQWGSRWAPAGRTRVYRMVEFIGRWSMLDIFVVTLTVALVRFQTLAVITAGPGALAFGCVVILTMIASSRFDPRLIWDPLNGESHA
ncbi:paraquat-inducible protein A [Pseudoduganella umbonata]|uniref:Paraquat-inducible protein A n=1 Tax=Pseudoduganella umbonata TaxID=864828 RepID=A0A4P8HPD0_9BURK|nr:paraquat-inducible protein A [Pseudoduganella umbonata]MBB3221131.1 paraquat-inducible protein A [Pseudoduganella umbonata]QCP10324.1 paraquat-inducible protein A [Pseudoduganella umbonata]